MEKMNPFGGIESRKSKVESPSGRGPILTRDTGRATQDGGPSYETRRFDLAFVVRKYADRLYARIKDIYKKYGVSSVAEMYAKVATGQKPNSLKSGELKSDVTELAKLVADLEFVLEKNVLPEGVIEAEEGEIVLRDVPKFAKLPSLAVFMDKNEGFKFDWVYDLAFREGRDIRNFALTEQDLQALEYKNSREQQELLQEIAKARMSGEAVSCAKVFDIGETIAKKKKIYPGMPDCLTTGEILEAMDKDGYRPATFEELLAFGKSLWKPDADPKALTDAEKSLQFVNAPHMYALGSPFTDTNGRRFIPFLEWENNERCLSGNGLRGDWHVGQRFLAVRKSRRSRTT